MRHLSLFTNVITIFNAIVLLFVVAVYTKDEHDEKFISEAPGKEWRPAFDIEKFQQRFFVSPSIKIHHKETFQCLCFFFHAEMRQQWNFCSLSTDSNGVHQPLSSSRTQFFFLGAHKNIYSTQTFDGVAVKWKKKVWHQSTSDLLWIKVFAYR